MASTAHTRTTAAARLVNALARTGGDPNVYLSESWLGRARWAFRLWRERLVVRLVGCEHPRRWRNITATYETTCRRCGAAVRG